LQPRLSGIQPINAVLHLQAMESLGQRPR